MEYDITQSSTISSGAYGTTPGLEPTTIRQSMGTPSSTKATRLSNLGTNYTALPRIWNALCYSMGWLSHFPAGILDCRYGKISFHLTPTAILHPAITQLQYSSSSHASHSPPSFIGHPNTRAVYAGLQELSLFIIKLVLHVYACVHRLKTPLLFFSIARLSRWLINLIKHYSLDWKEVHCFSLIRPC